MPLDLALILHRRHPQLLRRHLEYHVHHRCVMGPPPGLASPERISSPHLGQLLSQLAARVQLRKILSAESLAQAHCNGQRIAQRKHSCRRSPLGPG